MNESQEKFKIRKEVAEKWLSVKKKETSVWVINALEKISNLKYMPAMKTDFANLKID